MDEEGTTVEYIPLYQDNNGQMVSFPAEIVFNFHPETIQRFLKMKVGEAAPIHCVQDLDDFEIMDKDRIRPELIHDKIVIAGDLDVDDDYFVVEFPDGKRKTFSLVITANIVQQILLDNTGNINVTNGK